MSYAANLVVPRVGEISRCGVLAKYDGTSFSKSLGTVVAERLIDTLCVSLITGVTLIMQARVFDTFFLKKPARIPRFLAQVFTSGHFLYYYHLCVGCIGTGLFSDQECDGLCQSERHSP